jgi:hypothetical protein
MLDTAALAKKLGVSEAKLKAALATARPAQGATPQPGGIAAALAKALGISEAKVKAALPTPPSGAPGGTPPAAGQAPQGSGSSSSSSGASS